MPLTIVGTILLLSPFLFVFKFKDKRLEFVYVFSFVVALHLFTAIITQFFYVFNYPVVLGINAFVFLIAVLKTDFRKIFSGIKTNFKKTDWVLIFILVVTFISLFSVHYHYSGKYTIATTPQYQEGKNIKYPYPYFSDEWYIVAFIKDSIESHSLPLKNPLAPPAWSEGFINLEFATPSFLAGLILLLNLNPLTNYTILTIFSGLLIILLVYLFLRHSNVNKFSAGTISLSVLYLTNGANLPGIWYLIPLILGIISMLMSFFFVSVGDKKMVFFMAVPILLFYPPLFVFYSLGILFLFVLSKKLSLKEKIKNISYYLGIVVLAAIIVSVAYFLARDPQESYFPYIFSKIFYPTFIEGALPQYAVYNIVPIPILILAILGAFHLIMKRGRIWLLSMLFLGFIYWILYSFVFFRFIIEYERVVVFTSILVTITAGFGLSYLVEILKRINSFKRNEVLNYAQIGILILFFAFSFNYTKGEGWQKLRLVHFERGKTYLPATPANQYLHPDDLEVFKDIKEEKFLSLPWKGTVIGVATDNYPVSTKPGTITINRTLHPEFINSDCGGKNKIAENRNISYFYLGKLDCPNFELVDISSEGFHLYKFSKSVQ